MNSKSTCKKEFKDQITIPVLDSFKFRISVLLLPPAAVCDLTGRTERIGGDLELSTEGRRPRCEPFLS
jgi:hypothetical protein